METHDNLGWNGPLVEPTTAKIYKEKGRVAGLAAWLRRNRAYTFRKKVLGYDFNGDSIKTDVTYKLGFFRFRWLITENDYFQAQPEVFVRGVGGIYLNIGWKLTNENDDVKGTFMGIVPRVRKAYND